MLIALACGHNQLLLRSSVPTQHWADFFQPISDLLEQGQIIFNNMVNIVLENSTNLWKYDVWSILILDWYEN